MLVRAIEPTNLFFFINLTELLGASEPKRYHPPVQQAEYWHSTFGSAVLTSLMTETTDNQTSTAQKVAWRSKETKHWLTDWLAGCRQPDGRRLSAKQSNGKTRRIDDLLRTMSEPKRQTIHARRYRSDAVRFQQSPAE